MNCKDCGLKKVGTNIIHNNGSRHAKILLITSRPSLVDEAKGRILSGDGQKMFEKLLNDAAKIQSNISLAYAVTSIIKCRPTDKANGDTRDPSPHEILCCTKRLMNDVSKINPKIIFISGKLVERYYSKEFPDARKIMPMSFLAKQGGESGPWYKSTLRIILEALKKG